MSISIRLIEWANEGEREALYVLRSGVLRPGMPREASVYKGDDNPLTWHIGAWQGGELWGVGTFLGDENERRLRGMAVRQESRGVGIGAEIIRFAQERARLAQTPMWCNARESAIGFYERLGWVVEGDLFDVPDAGPHKVMRWKP